MADRAATRAAKREAINHRLLCRAIHDMIAGKIWGRFGLPATGRFWLSVAQVDHWVGLAAHDRRVRRDKAAQCLQRGLIPELVPHEHQGAYGWLWTGPQCPADAPIDHGAWPPHLARKNRYEL